MKRVALQAIKKVLEQELAGPIGYLKQLLEPFLQAYDFFTQTVKNIKEAWRLIRNGYQTARTLLEEIFGTKMHKDFPRKFLKSQSCGDGFWETDGNGHYSPNGIMLEVKVGQEGDTISQGTVLGMTKQDDTTPAVNGPTDDVDVSAMDDSDRKKRGVSDLIDKVNGKMWNKITLTS
ncbi:hypothetical protein LSAT2_002241 [Lamellibrachia satsuma]|nr:hypothetical protein LSAT2_002241 [Lamellibrachia satsuma]